MSELNVLSLGAGVQSSALLLMSERGLVPAMDAVVFADTGWEPQAVYDNIAWLRSQVTTEIVVVKKGNLREDALDSTKRAASMPLFTQGQDGKASILRRQCTQEYKIAPVDRWIKRNLLGLGKYSRFPAGVNVNVYMGISSDEITRMKSSQEKWKTLRYPFCGFPPLPGLGAMNRADILHWLGKEYPGREFPRSACLGCPFHSNAEWRNVRSNPHEWRDAVEFDYAIRSARPTRNDLFLHRELKPLDEVDIELHEDSPLFEECTGGCFT